MPTLTNFIQLFNFSNWTTTGNISRFTFIDPTTLIMAATTGTGLNVKLSITVPINGKIKFSYNAFTEGFLSYSPFGYIINNGSMVALANSSSGTDSGTAQIDIVGGSTFGFNIYRAFTGASMKVTITNFSFTYDYPICYNEGTKILCLNPSTLLEEYIEIEKLRKGDTVKSYKHGYRKIDLIGKKKMINNPLIFMDCMYKLEKTPENGLVEDLMLTGGHSILVDDFKDKNINVATLGQCERIDDKYLVRVGTIQEFVKQENNDEYTYYHFILENDNDDSQRFGVWANGMLTDTPSKTEFIDHNYELLH